MAIVLAGHYRYSHGPPFVILTVPMQSSLRGVRMEATMPDGA